MWQAERAKACGNTSFSIICLLKRMSTELTAM
eukprot:CAMPEP_0171251400 /NCGR_PEP_ID=MMETSP0790-20130122/50616_1 /TAXON_ID=2925 /ORGANISM="Alexandrium catenella, Strain OF101" /LENGTH=31 /DNA_ID= /DNA_START= /DNA_END= /DNA_ORIENTATION=